jgi:hypothetical protein
MSTKMPAFTVQDGICHVRDVVSRLWLVLHARVNSNPLALFSACMHTSKYVSEFGVGIAF